MGWLKVESASADVELLRRVDAPTGSPQMASPDDPLQRSLSTETFLSRVDECGKPGE